MDNTETNENYTAVPRIEEDAAEDTSRRAPKLIWGWTRRLIRSLWLAVGLARKLLVTAALILSLLFNGLLILSDTVQTAVAVAASAMGLTTVAARNSAILAAEKLKADELQRKVDATRKKVKNTIARVNRRAKNAAAIEFLGILPKAIPFAGIVAIGAGMLSELHEMCATMKDMAELGSVFGSEQTLDAEVPTVCGKEVPSRKELRDWAEGVLAD